MADLIGRQQEAKRHLAEFDALMESLRRALPAAAIVRC
jgi:iron complex transport system substrate-binding protein